MDRGVLIQVDSQFLLHATALEKAKQAVLKLFAKAPSFTTMDFRDSLGISRKFAVPILDYLDKMRFTVRNGHTRTPGCEARKALGK